MARWGLEALQDPVFYQRLGGAHSTKLQGWNAALAARQTRRVNVAVIGDSVTAGNGASEFSRTFCQRLSVALNARFPVDGLSSHGRGYLNPAPFGISPWSPDEYVTATPALTGIYGYGPAAYGYDLSADGGITVTYELVGDSADIIYATGGGVFSWAVDGGSATDVDTGGTFADGIIEHVSLGSAGAHTLAIAYVGGGATFIDGVVEFNTDYAQGIQVHDCGFGGTTSHSWTTAGGIVTQPAAMTALSPDLVIVELTANDNANGIVPAGSRANLEAVLANERAAYTSPPPFLLLATYNAYFNGPTPLALWEQYVGQMYDIAAADDQVDVLDLSLRMPPTNAADTYGLYAGDGIHPADTGHQAVADDACAFLSPA